MTPQGELLHHLYNETMPSLYKHKHLKKPQERGTEEKRFVSDTERFSKC